MILRYFGAYLAWIGRLLLLIMLPGVPLGENQNRVFLALNWAPPQRRVNGRAPNGHACHNLRAP